ncbi:MAG: M42 family metallopeptidase [Terriglobia bacterium]
MENISWTVILLFCLTFNFGWSSLACAQTPDHEVQLLNELTTADGPSGFEGPVRELFEQQMRAVGAEISTDGLGSVIATIQGTSARPRVMIDAHLDEVGLMVRYITPEAYIKVQTLGGWLGLNMVDQRWTILTSRGPLPAVSGTLDAHISTTQDQKWAIDPENVFLDVGAKSRADAEAMGVRPGDPIAPYSPFTELAHHRYAAKAWDDRIGLAMMIEAAKRLKEQGTKTPNTLIFVGTVEEEPGMRGAMTATNEVKPDLGIAIEVGIAADYPGTNPNEAEERLGAGPGIFLYDHSMLPNLKLRDFFERVAQQNNIPLQTDLVQGYGEDGSDIQKYANGRPAINFVVPTRYTHANTGIIDRADFDHGVLLLMDVLERLDARQVNEISSFR